MRPILATLALSVSLALVGCVAGGTSDPSQHWDISNAGVTESPVRTRVFLPSVLRQPCVVTYSKGLPITHDLDRWGTPLEEAIQQQLSSLLRKAPVQDVSVRIQQLSVSTSGNIQLSFSTEFTLLTNSNDHVTKLRSSGSVINEDKPDSNASLAIAVETYGKVPTALAESILQSVSQEQGKVAKPSATVTVPGK